MDQPLVTERRDHNRRGERRPENRRSRGHPIDAPKHARAESQATPRSNIILERQLFIRAAGDKIVSWLGKDRAGSVLKLGQVYLSGIIHEQSQYDRSLLTRLEFHYTREQGSTWLRSS
jgi:hypothetical protein